MGYGQRLITVNLVLDTFECILESSTKCAIHGSAFRMILSGQFGCDSERVISEAADLLYHTLVLLAERGLTLASVEQELDKRAGTS